MRQNCAKHCPNATARLHTRLVPELLVLRSQPRNGGIQHVEQSFLQQYEGQDVLMSAVLLCPLTCAASFLLCGSFKPALLACATQKGPEGGQVSLGRVKHRDLAAWQGTDNMQMLEAAQSSQQHCRSQHNVDTRLKLAGANGFALQPGQWLREGLSVQPTQRQHACHGGRRTRPQLADLQ